MVHRVSLVHRGQSVQLGQQEQTAHRAVQSGPAGSQVRRVQSGEPVRQVRKAIWVQFGPQGPSGDVPEAPTTDAAYGRDECGVGRCRASWRRYDAGSLVLSANPTANMGAATKQYVDSKSAFASVTEF